MDQFDQELEDDLFGEMPTESGEEPKENSNDSNYYESNYGFEKDDYNGESTVSETTTQKSDESDTDFMTRYLRDRGIDKNNIQIADEYGDLQSVPFDELTDDEKLAILDGANESPITDEELDTLNYLRENGLNINEYTELIQNQAIQDYLAQSQAQNFEIDNLNDDEVFVLDVINQFGDDMSNEEIEAELQRAKVDEEAFQKKVELIRSKYKQQESDNRQALEQQEAEARQRDFEEFTNSIAEAANNLNEIQGVELDPEDKQQIMDFLLTPDAANRTGFSKVLSDPDAIVKLAWFYLYGDQTFNATVDYFKNELSKSRRNQQAPRVVNKLNSRGNKLEPDTYGLDDVFK